MIVQEASLLPDEVTKSIKDVFWSDQRGPFENALGLGGHALMFVSGPLAILNVVGGMMGAGLSDIGRVIDGFVAGKKASEINVDGVARAVVDKIWPQMTASAMILNHGIVSLSASPKEVPEGIRFEQPDQPQPRGTPASRYEKIVDEAHKAKKPAPEPVQIGEPAQESPRKNRRPLGSKRDLIRAKHRANISERLLEHKHRKEIIALEEKLDQQAQEHKLALNESHIKVRDAAAKNDRGAMEHQIKVQSQIKSAELIRTQKVALTEKFINGDITPEQHRVLLKSLDGHVPTEKELVAARKSGTKASNEKFKLLAKKQAETQRQAVQHRKEMVKADGRNYRMWGAGARRAPGFLAAFTAKVGKAGIIAAIVAIIYAVIKSMSISGDATFPSPQGTQTQPLTRQEFDDDLPEDLRGSAVPVETTTAPAASSNKRTKNIGKYVKTELGRILGD